MPTENIDRWYYGTLGTTQVEPDGSTYVSTGEYPIRRIELSRTWVRTPGFKAGVKNGSIRRNDLPMNDYSYTLKVTQFPWTSQTLRRYVSAEGGIPQYRHYHYTGAIYGTSVTGPYYGPTGNEAPYPTIDLNRLEAKAANEHLLGVKDQKVNLVQAYAERGQTTRLMGETIKRLVGAVTSLKKGNLAGAARSLGVKASPRRIRKYTKSYSENQSKAIASGWLELQYGWKPLLSDIYGSAELIAQKQVREVRNRVATKAHEIAETTGTSGPLYYGGEIRSRCTRRVTIKYVSYFSTPSVNHTLAQVGITNPLLIAWELAPWSFVVDWFIPIGNYISSLDAVSGLTFEKGCRTYFEELTFYSVRNGGQGTDSVFPELQNRLIGSAVAEKKEIYVTRNAISAFPSPKLPHFKSPFSTVHVLNALALLRTSFTIR